MGERDAVIDGWKQNQTSKTGFDKALYPHESDPVLSNTDLNILLATYEGVQVALESNQIRVYIKEIGGDDER